MRHTFAWEFLPNIREHDSYSLGSADRYFLDNRRIPSWEWPWPRHRRRHHWPDLIPTRISAMSLNKIGKSESLLRGRSFDFPERCWLHRMLESLKSCLDEKVETMSNMNETSSSAPPVDRRKRSQSRENKTITWLLFITHLFQFTSHLRKVQNQRSRRIQSIDEEFFERKNNWLRCSCKWNSQMLSDRRTCQCCVI